MSTSSLYLKISGLLAGFALFSTCLVSPATAAGEPPSYPSIVVTTVSGDLELDWDSVRLSDTLFWQDIKKLEGQALIWRVNIYKHTDGQLIGTYMNFTNISNRNWKRTLPLDKLLRVHLEFCTTTTPDENGATCEGRAINILLHKYPD